MVAYPFASGERPICEVVSGHPGAEPDWHLAYWADKEGNQLLKFSSGEHATTFFNVGYRSYFKEALHGRTRCLALPSGEAATDGEASCSRHMGSVEVVRSDTMRAIRLVVSRPTYKNSIASEALKSEKPTGVAAIAVPMDQITDLVLPHTMTMAVVDRDGKIILHSNNDAHHGHSVFKDVGSENESELRAIFSAKIKETIDVRYLGKHTRTHIRYLPGPDWYLVLQIPKANIDGPIYHMMVFSLVGYGYYVVIFVFLLGAIVVIILKRSSDRHPLVIRPKLRLSSLYAGTGSLAWMLSFFLCVVATIPFPRHWSPIPESVMTLWLLSLTVLVAWPLFARTKSDTNRVRKLVCRWGEKISKHVLGPFILCRADRGEERESCISRDYFIWCWGFMGVLVFAPATLVFSSTFDLVAQNVVQIEQLHYASALEYQLEEIPDRDNDTSGAGGRMDTKGIPTIFADNSQLVDFEDGADGDMPTLESLHRSPRKLLEFTLAWFCPKNNFGFNDTLRYKTGGRRDRAQRGKSGESVDDGKFVSWGWDSRASTLNLVLSTVPGEQLTTIARAPYLKSKVPALYETLITEKVLRWVFLFLVTVLITILVAGIAYRSIYRLFSMKFLSEYYSDKELKRIVEASSSNRILISHGTEALARALNALGTVVDIDPLNVNDRIQLERQSSNPKRRLIVICRVNPIYATEGETRDRWAKILGEFTFLEASPPNLLENGRAPNEAKMLHIWQSFNEHEKKLIGKMAYDALPLPHPAVGGTLRSLVAKGVLLSNTLDFFHTEFKNLVRLKTTQEDLKEWEAHSEESTWNVIKAPLTTAVIMFFAALSVGFGSPELTATGAVAPTVALAMPVIIKALTSLSQKS
jgi:hypothetical protein